MIVGISGLAGSGKDTFANLLRDELVAAGVDSSIYHLADPLKVVVQYIFGLSNDDVNTQEGKKKEHPNCYGLKVREVLQKFGTESMRDVFSENVWSDMATRFVDMHGSSKAILVPDVRFKNEAIWTISSGGILIDVIRPNQEIIAGSTHRSEQGHGEQAHYTILNDGSLDDLKHKAVLVANHLRLVSRDMNAAAKEAMKSTVLGHFSHALKHL